MEKHQHHHTHSHHHHHDGQKNIMFAFFLNLSFALLEIVGGIWTNSMAILSDALHDLGDSLALGIAWVLEKVAHKKPDHKYSFGYARFSLLGAMINSLILIIGSIFILVNTIPRIIKPEPVNKTGMLIFAILGIIINGAAFLRLRHGSSLNEKTVSWHLVEDILGWVVLLIGSIVLMFTDFYILDPILSIGIALYILYHVVINVKQIMNIFLQAVPRNLSIEKITEELSDIQGVDSVHHLHLWSLEGEKNMLSTHITVADDVTRETIIEIKKSVTQKLHEQGINHVTIEIEFASEKCESQNC